MAAVPSNRLNVHPIGWMFGPPPTLATTDPGWMIVLDRQRRLSVADDHRMIGAPAALVVEVAGDSLQGDRLTKSAIYAGAVAALFE